MNTQAQSLFTYLQRSALTFLLFALPSGALEVEETILVAPGSKAVGIVIDAGLTVEGTYGPFHGQLNPSAHGYQFEPDRSFWDAGGDFVIIGLRTTRSGIETSLRVRLVAADTALDGIVSSPPDPGIFPAPLGTWAIDSSSVTVIPGLLAADAFELSNANQPTGPSLAVAIGDPASGNATTTSTTTVDIEVRDIPNWSSPANSWNFYLIREGVTEIAKLMARWTTLPSEGATSSGFWEVLPVNPSHVTGERLPLRVGRNRLKLVRWHDTMENLAGVDLYVNGRLAGTVDVPPMLGNTDETHEVLMNEIPTPGNLRLIIENPKVARSENLVDNTERLRYDSFGGGPGAAWTTINAFAQGTAAQNLPGPGDRFEIDLGQLASLDSSFIEAPVTFTPGGSLDPPGFAMRLWLDPTSVTLSPNSTFRVATACNEVDNCGAARIWLGHDGTSYTIAATAWRDGSPGARIEVPVSNEPHTVEVRLRHGWTPDTANGSVELWIDGEIAGAVTGLDNHASQVAKVRLGTLRDVAGSSGILGLDNYEAWHFK